MIALTADRVSEITANYKSLIEAALLARVDVEQEWADYERYYRGTPENEKKLTPWEGAANLVISLAGTYVDVVVARIMGAVFSVEPHWSFRQLNKRWARHLDPVERYVEACRKGLLWDQQKVIHRVVLDFCKLGSAVLCNGWADEPYYMLNENASERDPKAERLVETSRIKGPRPTWVRSTDWLLPAGFTDPQTAPWCAHRMWYTWQDLQRLLRSGSLDDAYIDREALEVYAGDIPTAAATEGKIEDTSVNPGGAKLYAIWYVWTRDDIDEDDWPEEYVLALHLGTNACLRLRANPYHRGMRPYCTAQFIVDDKPMGLCEMLRMYQEEVTTSHNQRVDNAHIANAKMVKARQGSGIKQNEKVFPGRVWLVADVADVQPFDLGQNYQSTVQEEQMTIALAEKRIGVSDMSLGRESSPIGRAAATTTLALLQENARRFDLNIMELRRALTMQGEQLVELWRQHGLPEPGDAYSPETLLDDESSLTGPAMGPATPGPSDAQLVREFFAAGEKTRGAVGVQLNVSTAAVNREVEKQSAIQLEQLVDQHMQSIIQLAGAVVNPQLPPRSRSG